MSRVFDKAAIARDTEKLLRAKDRDKLRAMRAGIVDLRRSLSRQKILDRKARRQALAKIRVALVAVPRAERAHRRAMAREVTAALADFRGWWAAVLIERANKRAEVEQLRQVARQYRAGSRERIRAGVAAVQRAAGELLEEVTLSAAARRERLGILLEQAERDLRTERNDQRQFRGTRKAVSRRIKAKPKERAAEFLSNVEANLLTAEEHATWHGARKQILATAKAKGIRTPDEIAELVREHTEADPDLAIDRLQKRAERDWAAEYRRQH